MRNRTTKEVIENKQLYALMLRSPTSSLYHNYFIGFYQHQGELFISSSSSFDNDNIKCYYTINGAKKAAEKIFKEYFGCLEDLIYIVDQCGKLIMVYDGKMWSNIKEV